MTLYTSSRLDVNRRLALEDPLRMDIATYLRWFDMPAPGAKLEHLGVMARVLIGTMVNQSTRSWGLITDLAKVFDTSRETIYTIGERIREGVFVRPNGRRPVQAPDPVSAEPPPHPTVNITPTRIKRTVLTNLLPGGMTIRPQIESLQVALDTHRSEGWICELILEAGERAGRKLDEINLSALGQVVTARDELYFSDLVFLLV